MAYEVERRELKMAFSISLPSSCLGVSTSFSADKQTPSGLAKCNAYMFWHKQDTPSFGWFLGLVCRQ